ncbi:MAG: hypothetical protein V4493_08670 [Pseudomonadota bacterium]
MNAILEWLADRAFKWVEERKLKKQLEAKDAELLKQYEDTVKAGETLSREERRRILDNLLNA